MEIWWSCDFKFYTLRGHEGHFLMKTMPEASGTTSRWLRSVSDDTTGRQRGIRSCTPAGVPQQLLPPSHNLAVYHRFLYEVLEFESNNL